MISFVLASKTTARISFFEQHMLILFVTAIFDTIIARLVVIETNNWLFTFFL